LLLARRAEVEPVVGALRDQEGRGGGGGGERDDVERLGRAGDLAEAARERQRQQEREQHLHAGKRDADLVEELDQLAVDALLPRLVAHRSTVPRKREGPSLGGVSATGLLQIAHRGPYGQVRTAVRIAQWQGRYPLPRGASIGRATHLCNGQPDDAGREKPLHAGRPARL